MLSPRTRWRRRCTSWRRCGCGSMTRWLRRLTRWLLTGMRPWCFCWRPPMGLRGRTVEYAAGWVRASALKTHDTGGRALGLVPRLRRSDHLRGRYPALPGWAEVLTAGPTGPRIFWSLDAIIFEFPRYPGFSVCVRTGSSRSSSEDRGARRSLSRRRIEGPLRR